MSTERDWSKMRGQVVSGQLNKLAADIHAWAVDKGFWPTTNRETQVAEAMAWLQGEYTDQNLLGPPTERDAQLLASYLRDRGGYDRNDGEMVAQFHSECTELLEAVRETEKGKQPSEKAEGHSAAEEEAADIIIRLLDTAHARGWDIGAALVAKMAHNEGRPWKHGRRF